MKALKPYIFAIVALAALLPLTVRGAVGDYLVRGIVRDSLTNEPVPMCAVAITGRTVGTLSDTKGVFELTVPRSTTSLTVTSQGYARKVVPIRHNRVNVYEVRLRPEAQMLSEVVVKRKKYSKKNNPAVDLMQRIRRTQDANDPRRNPFYNYDKYERIILGLNNFNQETSQNSLFKRFPFLWEHVDTSEVSGKPILPLSVKETSSQMHFRRDPRSERQVITGLKSEGVDELTDQESMRIFMQDVLREIDLYDRDINILQNRFVSPLSPLAADFYKFYITDSVMIDGEKAIQLSFYPHNKAAFGFVGQMYVVPSDTAMFIRRVTMRVPSEINLNFIDNMYVDQEFTRAADGSRLKVRDDMVLEVTVVPGTQGLYVRRAVAYANHNFDRPQSSDEIFAALGHDVIQPQARQRDEVFWQGVRLFELPPAERGVTALLTKMRSVPLFYWGEKGLKLLVSGYVPTKGAQQSKFDIGPLNTMLTGNTLEGFRMRLGGMTTANLSKHWFTRFYGAYGFRDHKFKYGLELEYSFNEKRYHSREFPVHSFRLNSNYDIDQIGQNYMFTNADNFVLALKRMDDDRVSYLLHNSLTYTLELANNFSVTAVAAQERQFASRLLKFSVTTPMQLNPDTETLPVSLNAPLANSRADATVPSKMLQTPLSCFNQSWGELTLRYAPGEKFYQTKSYRIPINQDAPVLTLTHRYGPASGLGNRWGVNRTEGSVAKRFWFSAWGYLDVLVKGGHVWSKGTPYTLMFIPNANLSYTVQPESFTLMNAMEFVTDSYCSTDITYWANGAILNYIPFVKRAKLREVFSVRTFWGKLSDANNPRVRSGMLAFPTDGRGGVAVTDVSRTPYVEVGVGLDNILRCLRLDYVWRITHRHPGYPIDRSGLRVAFHMTF